MVEGAQKRRLNIEKKRNLDLMLPDPSISSSILTFSILPANVEVHARSRVKRF